MIFGGMIAAGIVRGVKEVREFHKGNSEAKKPPVGQSIDAQVAAITILENATLSEWTRSNKLVCENVGRLVEAMDRAADNSERTIVQLAHNRDEMQDYRHATGDLRRAIQELGDDIRREKRP